MLYQWVNDKPNCGEINASSRGTGDLVEVIGLIIRPLEIPVCREEECKVDMLWEREQLRCTDPHVMDHARICYMATNLLTMTYCSDGRDDNSKGSGCQVMSLKQ